MKVYGTRTCHYCKGICHRRSWRTKATETHRRRYWCSLEHLQADKPYLGDADVHWRHEPVV